MEDYVKELKELVLGKVNEKRDDLEDLNEDLKEKRNVCGWLGGCGWFEYEEKEKYSMMSIEWKGEGGKGELKEELYNVFNSCKVLNCGKDKKKRFIGLFSECVCVGYDKGKENWYIEGDLFYRFEGDKEWSRLKGGV